MLRVDIHKTYKSKTDATRVSCAAVFKEKEITVLFGQSGSGKTSILRMISGLDQPDTGTIVYDGATWFDHTSFTPVKGRSIGMVFQDFNLFKHMSVLQNLAYAANGKMPDQLEKLAEDLGISELYARYPHQLSKGQQQKVAIIRSLCVDSKVLLLDEPFSALDDDAILELMDLLDQIKTEMRITIILVTHRKDVVLKMAQSVVMLETGVQGLPQDLIERTF